MHTPKMGCCGFPINTILTIILLFLHQLIVLDGAPSSDNSGNNMLELPRRNINRSNGQQVHFVPNHSSHKQYIRLRPSNDNVEFLIDEDDIFSENKRQFDDYGHMRFGKREDQFDDYGHMRFGRSGTD